jgi:hypothetical protein
MFSSSKVSQAMIDAVNSVLGQTKPEPVQEVKTPEEGGRVPFAPAVATTLTEGSEKVSTSTGMKVYGSSYGNSKKARADQLKRPVDDVKRGPTTKELTGKNEEAKPDFLDMDKDGNKKESMKKAIADKNMKEELKGNQDKIDANHNNKIDSQDFAILRKKKVKEGMEFANKLLETVRKSDVPAYLRKAKGDTPLTVADVKGPKKDSISAPENLAKAKNEWKEEVEQIEERDEGKHNNGKTTGFNVVAAKAAKEYGSKEAGARVAGAIRKKVLAKEGSYEPSDAPITTDTLAGRLPGGKSNSFKSFKTRVKSLDKEGNGAAGKPSCDEPEMTAAQRSIKTEETIEEVTIAGTPGWKEMKKDVKDKSGAVHTPMSRAKDLARSAFKKIQKEVK